MTQSDEPVSDNGFQSFSREEWLWLGLIMLGAMLFYLPYLGRQFMGDDWLWLSNAKKALSDPQIIIERPMYGYFRPLNMVIVMALSQVFGICASAFSFVSITLHALNAGVLWIVLRRFGFDLRTRSIAAIGFAFYVINCSAIEWISVGHDLWVTLLCLLVILKTLSAIERPSWGNFVQIWLLSAAATLIKESGFVSLGLYFALLILRGVSPLDRRFRVFSIFFLLSFAAFLVGYASTRTFVDRDVSLGVGTFLNLWYFLTYIALPLSQRIVALVPVSWVWVLQTLKVVVTCALPVVAAYLWWRGGTVNRLALLWSIMFVATIAIMTWDVGLFTLYSTRTAARFMYSPALGYAIGIAWLWSTALETRIKWLKTTAASLFLAALFIGLNFAAVYQTSQLYDKTQDQVSRTIEDLTSVRQLVDQSDSLVISANDPAATSLALGSEAHVEAILFVVFDRTIGVRITNETSVGSAASPFGARTMRLRWSDADKRLVP